MPDSYQTVRSPASPVLEGRDAWRNHPHKDVSPIQGAVFIGQAALQAKGQKALVGRQKVICLISIQARSFTATI